MSAAARFDARFADRAAQLAGIAGALAGWPPDTFWRATPAELHAVLRALAGGAADTTLPPDAALLAELKGRFADG